MIWVAAGTGAAILALVSGATFIVALVLGTVIAVGGSHLVVLERHLLRLSARVAELEQESARLAEPAPAPTGAGPIAPPSIAAVTDTGTFAAPPAAAVLASAPATAAAVGVVPDSGARPISPVLAQTPSGGPPAPAKTGPSVWDNVVRAIGPAGSSREGIEAWISGRVLAIVGGAALILGALFFLSLAFSRGWIGPELRVVIGFLAGGALLGGSAWLLDRGFGLLGHVLAAVGLGVLSLTLFAATRLYGLIPPELGLGIAFLVACLTAAMAIRSNSQVIALFGLVAVLAAPPIMGATPNLMTVAFLGASLVGTAAISLRKGWPWPPIAAFLLTAPQIWVYVRSDPTTTVAVIIIAAYATLNALAALGTATTGGRREVFYSSVGLLLANALFAAWASMTLLAAYDPAVRGAFLAGAGLAHIGLAGWSFIRRGAHDEFAIVAAAAGLTGLAVALPTAFEEPPVAIGWAILAVALTAVAGHWQHREAAIGATVMGGLAVIHLAFVEYLPGSPWMETGVPFVDPAGLTLASLLIAGAIVGVVVPRRWVHIPLAAVAILLVALGCWYELGPFWILVSWAALAVIAVAIQTRVFSIMVNDWPRDVRSALEHALYGSAALIGILTLGQFLIAFAPPERFVDGVLGLASPPQLPFVDETTLAAAIVAPAAALAGVAINRPSIVMRIGIAGAGVVVAYLVPFELVYWLVPVAWSAIGAIGLAAGLRDRIGQVLFGVLGSIAIGVATTAAIAVVAPPERLAVDATAVAGHPLLLSEATLALGACALGMGFGAWLHPGHRFGRSAALGAAILVIYLLSVGVVDYFQGLVGSSATPLEELQKQAQVALSVLWIVIGAIGFPIGLVRRIALVRQAGLALLGVATIKVFVVDLAFLDVAYRVPPSSRSARSCSAAPTSTSASASER